MRKEGVGRVHAYQDEFGMLWLVDIWSWAALVVRALNIRMTFQDDRDRSVPPPSSNINRFWLARSYLTRDLTLSTQPVTSGDCDNSKYKPSQVLYGVHTSIKPAIHDVAKQQHTWCRQYWVCDKAGRLELSDTHTAWYWVQSRVCLRIGR